MLQCAPICRTVPKNVCPPKPIVLKKHYSVKGNQVWFLDKLIPPVLLPIILPLVSSLNFTFMILEVER